MLQCSKAVAKCGLHETDEVACSSVYLCWIFLVCVPPSAKGIWNTLKPSPPYGCFVGVGEYLPGNDAFVCPPSRGMTAHLWDLEY